MPSSSSFSSSSLSFLLFTNHQDSSHMSSHSNRVICVFMLSLQFALTPDRLFCLEQDDIKSMSIMDLSSVILSTYFLFIFIKLSLIRQFKINFQKISKPFFFGCVEFSLKLLKVSSFCKIYHPSYFTILLFATQLNTIYFLDKSFEKISHDKLVPFPSLIALSMF